MDDQGRVNRERARNRGRRDRHNENRREARALAREARENRLNLPAAEEAQDAMERELREEYSDQDVTDLNDSPRLASVILLAVILGQRSALSETCQLHAANRYLRDIREKLENGFEWNDELGDHFQLHHDQR